jgi:hypothetical protein
MDIIVDRPQLVRVVLLYLNMNFGNLTPKTSSQLPNSVFYVNSDNEIMVEYAKKNKYVWVHYYQIWSKIRSLFSLEFDDTQSIIQHWLERDYNFRNLKPNSYIPVDPSGWKKITI